MLADGGDCVSDLATLGRPADHLDVLVMALLGLPKHALGPPTWSPCLAGYGPCRCAANPAHPASHRCHNSPNAGHAGMHEQPPRQHAHPSLRPVAATREISRIRNWLGKRLRQSRPSSHEDSVGHHRLTVTYGTDCWLGQANDQIGSRPTGHRALKAQGQLGGAQCLFSKSPPTPIWRRPNRGRHPALGPRMPQPSSKRGTRPEASQLHLIAGRQAMV
jgi:hypothetical protein